MQMDTRFPYGKLARIQNEFKRNTRIYFRYKFIFEIFGSLRFYLTDFGCLCIYAKVNWQV